MCLWKIKMYLEKGTKEIISSGQRCQSLETVFVGMYSIHMMSSLFSVKLEKRGWVVYEPGFREEKKHGILKSAERFPSSCKVLMKIADLDFKERPRDVEWFSLVLCSFL